MDMALYSLVKNKIKETDETKVDKVGNYEIRFVESESEATMQDTLYFVFGGLGASDKFIVGGRGIASVIFNGVYIDYGILNGNTFLNKFDNIRNYERLPLTSINGSIIEAQNTVDTPILNFSIVGQNDISYVENIVISNADNSLSRTIEVNDYFIGTGGGANRLDLITGEYNKDYVIGAIDGTLKWTGATLYNDYRQFKCNGYTNKPEFLNFDKLYDSDVCMPLTSENAVVKTNSDNFVIADDNRKRNCIYVDNKALYIRIEESVFANKGSMAYNAFLQQYLTEHPIEFAVKKVNPTIETKLSIAKEQPINAYEGETRISINCKDETYPIVNVELPIHKGVENL